MAVSFDSIKIGREYSRAQLADIWHFTGPQAIARGLFTPKDDNKVILFITRERRSTDEPYENKLVGDELTMDGPNGHGAEVRMLNADRLGDEVHLFYRDLHNDLFGYYGIVDLVGSRVNSDKPSRFVFRLRGDK